MTPTTSANLASEQLRQFLSTLPAGPDTVIWQEGLFSGLTLAKAIVLNDAFVGREVLVEGRNSVSRGIFVRIILPGEPVNFPHPYAGWFELEIAESWHGRKCGYGYTRHLGVGAVKRLEVIGPEYGFCEDCCQWVPKEDLRDRGEAVGEHRMSCRSMDHDGACR